ncbi:MAG: glycine zipper domain-containing protein [bacterium]|jgi:uncharacterized protein YcfJ|nr:glycine zipper domain-containing protein [bacterium]
MNYKLGIIMLLGLGLFMTGCTATQKGAAVGGGVGAGLGAIIGHQSGRTGEGALIGGAVGALGGALINDAADKQKKQAYEEGYYQGAAQNQQYSNQQQQYQYNPR